MASGQGLTLLSGPANAGKVALLLERYLGALERDPWLIVPHGSDVERIERELLAKHGALLTGDIGTFDDLFAWIARDGGSRGRGHRRAASADRSHRRLRHVAERPRRARRASPASPTRSETTLAELESGLVDPGDLRGDLALLYASYRGELERLEPLGPRPPAPACGRARLLELDAWSGRPVFAYGFEDLTGAQWALLNALAGRTEVTVSLPYEPNRAPFESLEAHVRRSRARSPQDGSRSCRLATARSHPPALAHLERHLFSDEQPPARRSTARSGSSKEPARAARSSSSPTRP